MNLRVPQNGLTGSPDQQVVLHCTIRHVLCPLVMMNVLFFAARAATTLADHQNTVLFVQIMGKHTLSMKTLCWQRFVNFGISVASRLQQEKS